MTSAEDVSRAYTLWAKAHKDLIEAETLLYRLGPDAPISTRADAQRKVQELRTISDALLELSTAVRLKHESGREDSPG